MRPFVVGFRVMRHIIATVIFL